MVSTNKQFSHKQKLITPDVWFERYIVSGSEKNKALINKALQLSFNSLNDKYTSEQAFQNSLITAELLLDLHMDSESLAAAIISHTVTTGNLELAIVEKQLGRAVAELVDGICKMNLINRFNQTVVINHQEDQSENLRRMLLAMANDVRVVLITLAARVVAMRSVKNNSDEEKRAIAKETMDIYAPLANRLGIWQFKWELEDH